MFLDFSGVRFRYEPFPIGIAAPVMADSQYAEFLKNFPPVELFADYDYLGKPGVKLTLSENEDRKTYRDFVLSTPPWREFYTWVKSDAFVYGIMDTLRAHDLDLGYTYAPTWKRLAKAIRRGSCSDYEVRNPRLSVRFEFSILKGNGGSLPPHTDAPSKVSTIIISMATPDEWNAAWGGGTDVNAPKQTRWSYNHMNRTATFEDMEILHTYPFEPNQAIIFVKTHNSWHSVRPITANDPNVLRRTLTLNIEKYR